MFNRLARHPDAGNVWGQAGGVVDFNRQRFHSYKGLRRRIPGGTAGDYVGAESSVVRESVGWLHCGKQSTDPEEQLHVRTFVYS